MLSDLIIYTHVYIHTFVNGKMNTCVNVPAGAYELLKAAKKHGTLCFIHDNPNYVIPFLNMYVSAYVRY